MPDDTTKPSVLVMTGKLSEFCLPDVLQVVAMSRQYTSIELRRADGRAVGVIWLKAGRVIDARCDRAGGRAALRTLFATSSDVFVVERLPEPTEFPTPLGSLSSLLMEVVAGARPSEPTPAAAVPAPTPAHVAPPRPTARSVSLRAVPPPSAPSAPPIPASPAPPAPAPTPPLVTEGEWEGWDDALLTKTRPGTGTTAGVAVAVASPKGGVGKTTITLNLALSMAQRGVRTLIIDADINGDLLSLLSARDRVARGVYDVLGGSGQLEDVLRDTAHPNLRLAPASGPELPAVALDRGAQVMAWRALLERARHLADLVLIDCPAGMFDTTADVLASSTHVIGVLQAEMVATRSAAMFERGLSALPVAERPAVLGMVVNMFQGRSVASLEAFHLLTSDEPRRALFETTIPRSDAFALASLTGVPVRLADSKGQAPPVAWLFDMLASELCDRAGLRAPVAATVSSFLR